MFRRLFSSAPDAARPSRKILRYHFLVSALPMTAFGFMDNTIMIRAGDFIDTHVGSALHLDTLTAAACGQALSDVCGVTFGSTIAAIAAHYGLKPVQWSDAHANLRSVRILGTAGAAVGVFLGCCVGMTNLLFMDLGARERTERQQQLRTIFATVVEGSREVIDSEIASIWLVAEDRKTLWTMAGTGINDSTTLTRQIDWKTPGAQAASLTVACALQGEVLVVEDCWKDPRFNKDNDRLKGVRTRNMLCVPVVGKDGEVVGVVQFVNKRPSREDVASFTANDVKLARMMAHHVAIFLAQANQII